MHHADPMNMKKRQAAAGAIMHINASYTVDQIYQPGGMVSASPSFSALLAAPSALPMTLAVEVAEGCLLPRNLSFALALASAFSKLRLGTPSSSLDSAMRRTRAGVVLRPSRSFMPSPRRGSNDVPAAAWSACSVSSSWAEDASSIAKASPASMSTRDCCASSFCSMSSICCMCCDRTRSSCSMRACSASWASRRLDFSRR
mmetsp:Transcript_40253/g.80682  ORF Transcript_40253/g.80682 Transcript_40253/m.80682 type:complete len:201 (-) Transcript_40253:421-1023(-)